MVSVPTAPAVPLRALLYDRVSTVVQAKSGYSGGADGFQLDRCRAYADARTWNVIGTLTDTDSGAKWQLAGIMEAIERAKRGEYDVLIVSDTSRFARSFGKKIVYEADLKRHGVTVYYTNLPALPSDDSPESRLTNNIMGGVYGALDEYDRDKRTFWTSQGRLKKAKRGLVVGGGPPPYGLEYVTVWDETKKKHVPIGLKADGETADVVRRLYRDIAHHSSIDLAAALTADGIATPTGRGERWAKSTVRRVLTSHVYRGEWHFADVVVPVPAIVDERTWAAAQQLLSERRAARRGRDGDRAQLWELRGLLRCAHCDGLLSTNSNPIASKSTAWPGGRQRRYVCARSVPSLARRDGSDPCPLPGLLAADERRGDGLKRDLVGIEALSWAAVTSLLSDAGRLQAKLDSLREEHAGAREEHAHRVQDLDAEITTHERLMRRAEEEKLKLETDDERYRIHDEAGQKASGTVRRLKLDRERLVALPAAGLTDDEERQLARYAAEIRVGMEHAGPAERRRLYQILRLRGRVCHDPEHGQRIGRDARVCVEWETVLDSGQGFLKLCLLQSSSGLVLSHLERVASGEDRTVA